MQSGIITIILLSISACLCAVAAVYFSNANVFNDKRRNIIITLMGTAAVLWNVSSLGYTISIGEIFCKGFFSMLIVSYDLYMVALCLYISKLVGMRGEVYSAFVLLGIILSVGDFAIFGLASTQQFFKLGIRTAFCTKMSHEVVYHYFYIVFFFLLCELLVLYSFKKSKLRREHRFVLSVLLANCILFVMALPDTFLPLFNIASYPSSAMGVTIAFIATIFITIKENAFTISKDKVTNIIFQEANLAIFALNTDGSIENCNSYARTLFGLEPEEKGDFMDLIKASEEQQEYIMSGQVISEHLHTARTDISCSIRSAVPRDDFGDSYGIVVMATDATLEEKVMEQSIMLEKNEHMTYQLVQTLSKTIEAKDKYTNGHSERVAKYSVMIGKRLGYDKEKLKTLEYSALLHDVGKIGISDAIINKNDKLTDEEFAEIKKHPIIGAEILSGISEMPEIENGARWHHEKYGGTGYPDGKSGKEITEIARIIGVADAYDAMTSTRSYRDCLPQDVVRGELERCSGKQFDPRFAKIMLEIMDEDKDYELKETSKMSSN